MKTEKIISWAEKTLDKSAMRSSAEINIQDAKMWLADGNQELARFRAIKALQYTVGIFSPFYKRAISGKK